MDLLVVDATGVLGQRVTRTVRVWAPRWHHDP